MGRKKAIKSNVLVWLSIAWAALIMIATFLPGDTFRFSKAITYLVLSLPPLIGLVLILFSRSCPRCGRWMSYFWRKRRCAVCGTEIG
ncbi:MAG TPA: hypothetical protein PLG17_05375 [Thermodesulfobacteriota bacterium]|nr:hypothetical protein [Deltaproteobacteria bacterium]HNR14183.1 hypothetical protein [Thermodesulfobacteriota bacterium]HNU70621.1 hypothetical protein [Thermodesulfobacteriota bacterium]HOC38195.1 hypothetical protein [Thermodesulfobacteriota bacterium]HQO77925.1 hypothetical protein [Thermodesulfobacteriota bacterium]